MSNNLEPKQYQLGDFVFGEGTMFPVETFDVGGYDVNVQDFQIGSSDELRFGQDTLKPLPIQITMTALNNWQLPNIASLVNETREFHFENDRKVDAFVREWRADTQRMQWGELKPLMICRPDGSVVLVYGRPGKIAVSKPMGHNTYRKIVAEYRRSDTLAYSEQEWFLSASPNTTKIVARSSKAGMGSAASWLRFILIGPMTHPIINLGLGQPIELDHELNVGDVVEISGYPWARRVIDLNTGQNLSAKLVSPYLDQLKLDIDTAVELSWTATDINATVETRDFSTYPNGTVIQDFTVRYVDEDAGAAGTVSVSNGKIQWNDSGNKNRLANITFNEPTVTGYQRVGFQMVGSAESSILGFTDECANRIYGRCNEDGTEYLFWDITYSRLRFGFFKDGKSNYISPVYEIPRLRWFFEDIWGNFLSTFGQAEYQGPDWTYEAEFGTGAGQAWSSLWINGHLMVNFIGVVPGDINNGATSGVPTFFDDNHLLSGISMRATPRVAGQSTPGAVSKFWVSDNPPPEVAQNLNVSKVFMLWRDAWAVI